jgi:phosphatidylglycerophosphatase A
MLRHANWVLFLAQGFGVGRIPSAPGTWGSLLGLGWLALLVWPGSTWCYLGGISVGFLISVWAGGRAEELLQAKDPGSVVIDEITALPLGFAGVILLPVASGAPWPSVHDFFCGWHGLIVAAGFGLFRLFDIAKPWPIRGSQKLPGGWGLTVDDFLAASYVALLLPVLEAGLRRLFNGM